jgi:uncharacterized membrane protein YesL
VTAAVKVNGRQPQLTGRLNVSADAWETIWSYLHRVLVINLGVAIMNLPLFVALAVVQRPWQYPVFFGVLALSLGPSVAAAFSYLHGSGDHDRPTVLELARAYRRFAGRAVARWAITVALFGVLVTDIVALHDSTTGALLVPLLAVTSVLVLAAGVLSLAGLALHPEMGLRRSLATAAYTAVSRWWLSLTSLTVLTVAAVAVNQAPVLGLATLPGCALIVTWANSRTALSRVTPSDHPVGRSPASAV